MDVEAGDITWIFSAEVLEHKTPSREDGISWATERKYRREGARFIINASNALNLRRDTLATGAVFFHRFYMVQSFKEFDRWVVACTCMLLAGKVEDTPKQCKSIIKVAQQFLTQEQMKVFGSNPKEELLCHERVLLQTIRFDLQIDHPYNYLLKFAQNLRGDKAKIEHVVQMAWTFINDSLCTALCLQWEPPAIAVAMLYLSGKLSKFDLQSAAQSTSNKRSWWRQFVGTVDVHDLESICHQVLDVYGEEEKIKAEKEEKESTKMAAKLSTGQSTPVSSNGPPVPTPPSPATNLPHISSSTHPSYPAHSLHQAASHPPQQQNPIVIPQAPPINTLGAHVGTPPSIMGAYQPLISGHHQHSTYHHSLVGTSHYQTTAALQQQLGVGGVSHINQLGSHYPPGGINLSPVVSARQSQSGSSAAGVSGLVYPTHVHGAAGVPTSLHNPNQPHYPHHHQTYHSNTGNWR